MRRCTSTDCGLLWLDPVPVTEDLPRLYDIYYTHTAVDRPRAGVAQTLDVAMRRAVLQKCLGYEMGISPLSARLCAAFSWLFPSGRDGFLAEAMFLRAPRESARLLEIGCGSGEALARMRGLGWEVLGTDFDERAVEVARGRGLDVRCGGVEAVREDAEGFDAIYLGHVLEHVPDPLALFRECAGMLREGGAMVVLTPNAESWGLRLFGPNWRGLEPPRHLHVFGPGNLRKLCGDAGLVPRTVRSTARGARYVLAMSLASKADGANSMPGLGKRFTGLILQFVERMVLSAGEGGEEVVLVAVPHPTCGTRWEEAG